MNFNRFLTTTLACGMVAGMAVSTSAEDWPMWGRTVHRNMHSPMAENLPSQFKSGDLREGSNLIDMSTTQNIKWVAKMGSQTYGNPVVADGRVYVGTNNDGREDERFPGDYSLLKCLDQKTGETQWILTVPKLQAGKVSDWEYLGICSSPTIDGERAYVITNRSEVVCLDVKGLSDGNQGFSDEGRYMMEPGESEPVEVRPEVDADILWVYDMREQLGVFPHNITSSSPLVVGDYVYTATSNGVDWSHSNIPNPRAPALIALDKMTGELVGEEGAGISERLLHSNWSSPAYGEVNGQGLIFFGAGDGYCYAFKPEPVEGEGRFPILEEVWRFDATRPYRENEQGEPIKYATPQGPSEIIATPVFHEGRVYVAIGQDPEHGTGVGRLVCIDASGEGDITTSGAVWSFDGIDRTISTVAIAGGHLYAADYTGLVYCLDPQTGELLWKHDTFSHIWGSPMAADGKVYIGNESGDLLIFEQGDEKNLLNTVNMYEPILSSPIAADNTLYVATASQLYAIAQESGGQESQTQQQGQDQAQDQN